MSATGQQFNFAGKAEGIASALKEARREIDEAAELAREIAQAADNIHTSAAVKRLETGVISEARTLGDYIRESFPSAREFEHLLRDVRDFQALLDLVTRDGEAAAS
jgi:hypothetical protein